MDTPPPAEGWFDVDPPREGTPTRWTERAEDEEQGR